MGISDRYYMNDSDESANFAGRRFTAVNTLIIINIVVWLAWRIAMQDMGTDFFRIMAQNFEVHPMGVLQEYRIHTLLTSAISHISFTHILFNMMFFYFLAEDVERIYGYRNLFWLYAFCGVCSSLAFVGLEAARTSGELFLGHAAVGASGAISGIAIVAAIFDPNKPTSFFGLIHMPLKWLVLIYLVMDLLGVAEATKDLDALLTGGGTIAHVGHLGGALGGFLFYKLDLRMFSSPGRADVGIWTAVKRIFRRKPSLRIVERKVPEELPREPVAKAERVARAAAGSSRPPPRNVDAATSQRVDELLSKISREGMGALTDEERTFLKESSQKYKK